MSALAFFSSMNFTSGGGGGGPAVSTLAGSTSGYVNATGTSAKFSNPQSVAIDGLGNLYVADTGNNRIRKVVISTGAVTLLAGSGSATYASGTGASASFNAPTGIACDSSGNVYVTDTQNFVIRKITPAGVTSVLAGIPGTLGSAVDGIGNAIGQVYGIVIDPTSTFLYFIEFGFGRRIRKVQISNGNVTTIAGNGTIAVTNGTGTSASFQSPFGITLDSSGNLFVTDANSIRKITPSGVVTTFASGLYSSTPKGITADASDNLYVLESCVVRKLTPAAVSSLYSGSTITCTAVDSSLALSTYNFPWGICFGGSTTFYMADGSNNRIRKLT